MYRRSFLQSSITLVLLQSLLGCTNNNQETLTVQLLRGSIPAQVVDKFRRALQQKAQLNFAPVEQLRDLYQELQTWHNQSKTNSEKKWNLPLPLGASANTAADLVTLGDYWLKTAIEQKLIQPLEVGQLKQWPTLPQRWQELVTRNEQGYPDPQGRIWAAPYRWGSTVIVYDRDKFRELGWIPTDWSDLWRRELRDRISVLNQPREVIGLVLKKLGASYNTQNLESIPNLEQELSALNQQVKLYSSTRYLEPLIIGDTWLAVGWSNDVLPVIGRYPQLAAVTPQSGTALWADVWVRPASATNENLAYQWIDFCWLPNIAEQISLLARTNSPISPKIEYSNLQAALRNLLRNNNEIFAKSEFLLPLPPDVTAKYESLFNKIRG
ncbi:extracellular solute-binding protein [Chlorogloeopsis sp. ULAP01]|uniref:extracellular solute-binding protein n=1 Tax=Chlorogloeopsis sp. ULAP01 TaxID=3056483 RepID=UPI0025AA8789|nr:extracellular solute-binding protein [Chlorogloeopsis sp. ULAP01]MDM9379569.1 extracellular solute-binding protein [Chlorogloeopsis sp. ULAP01]